MEKPNLKYPFYYPEPTFTIVIDSPNNKKSLTRKRIKNTDMTAKDKFNLILKLREQFKTDRNLETVKDVCKENDISLDVITMNAEEFEEYSQPVLEHIRNTGKPA